MIRFFYSLFFYSVSPLIWSYLTIRAIKAPEYRDGFLQRLGFVPQGIKSGGVVIHCASVGETIAAVPLINRLIEAYPEKIITVTTSTPTGKKTVVDRFGNKVQHLYLPGDWIGAVNRFINRMQPELVILMETELWFNLLHRCHNQSIPVLLANARLSEKSLKQYLKYPKFSFQLFNLVTRVAAQYKVDEENFKIIGVDDANLLLVGSIKFDISVDEELKQKQTILRKQWAQSRPVWIAASIHPGEFAALLDVQQALIKQFPELIMLAVPRHPEQFAAFKKACQKANMNFISRSDNTLPHEDTHIIVGDTMGEMMLFYGVADVAYVGGSLIKRGGHNPLEPVACGVPVLMGEHVYNFSDITEKLIDAGILSLVSNSDALKTQLVQLLTKDETWRKKSERCESFMAANQGTVDRLMLQIKSLITS